MNSLFENYPVLKKNLPYVQLGEFPTPVKRLQLAGRELGLQKLYIKRDDLSSKPYGGNKVRKLELLLGKAIQKNYKSIITFGAAGSNHALATAVYAEKLGLECNLYLMPQPNAQYVRKNLLMDYRCGAKIQFFPSALTALGAAQFNAIKMKFKEGHKPMIIPFGGTTVLSNIAHVNAAFELRDQIENGKMPEPDFLYVALGSMGTAAGLILGLKLCGLKTKVIPIKVVPYEIANERRLKSQIQRTINFLNSKDKSFPKYEIFENEIEVRHEYLGDKYAQYTSKSVTSIKFMKKNENIPLEGTYTGKAFAALMDDAKGGFLKDKVVLFWDTYNSRDFESEIRNINYKDLPKTFHRFFEDKVQPLDRKQ